MSLWPSVSLLSIWDWIVPFLLAVHADRRESDLNVIPEETLSLWRERFFRQLAKVRQLGFDDRFTRMWDFYLGWCEGAFREYYVDAVQVVIARKSEAQRAPAELGGRRVSAVRA